MKMAISINDKKVAEIKFRKSPLEFAGEHMADDYSLVLRTEKRNRWIAFRKRAKWNRANPRQFFTITQDRYTRIVFARPNWYLVIYP